MQNYKRNFLSGSLILFLAFSGYAQSMPQMPQMPTMPSVTMPSMDGTAYTPQMPQFPSNPFVNQQSKPKNLTNNNNNNSDDKNAADSKKQNTANQNTLNTAAKNNMINSLFTGANRLTATDVNSLYESGMFGNISSLYGGLYGNQNVNSGSTDLLLEQILLNLEDLKQKQNNASAQDKTQYKNQLADNENFKTRDPKVLRFKINGNNLTDSLTTVFFSETEPDGTFLFTADRQYYLNQHARTETIYLLFKTVKSNGSITTYVVQPTVMQDYKNDSSLLYRISTQQNLTAEKTGNLVTMHCSAADFSVELLLDVDSKK